MSDCCCQLVGFMWFFVVCMIVALALKIWQLFFKDLDQEGWQTVGDGTLEYKEF